jgi:hypothetical protein
MVSFDGCDVALTLSECGVGTLWSGSHSLTQLIVFVLWCSNINERDVQTVGVVNNSMWVIHSYFLAVVCENSAVGNFPNWFNSCLM